MKIRYWLALTLCALIAVFGLNVATNQARASVSGGALGGSGGGVARGLADALYCAIAGCTMTGNLRVNGTTSLDGFISNQSSNNGGKLYFNDASLFIGAAEMLGAISNTGASNGGNVYISDGLRVAGRINAYRLYTSADRPTCDVNEAGSIILYDDGSDKWSHCACEQTGAATYAWGAITATGSC